MLTAICRYGVRVVPGTEQIVRDCRRRGELIQGPKIAEFEEAFARRLGGGYASTASLGRMAFYYILRALDLPPGSEIIVPALTFWVVPEMARLAGLRLVFVDINPRTFTMDPQAIEKAITPATRAVVPTHLYGVACDMDAIGAIASRHNLKVIEDCAHALGTTYRGRPAGTLGDASFFSFQSGKPLNAYGGGISFTRDAALGQRIATLAAAEPWPQEERILKKLRVGRIQRFFTHPLTFTLTGFPILWVASLFHALPDIYMWEHVRPLDPAKEGFCERFSNVQAAIALEGLKYLDQWNERCRQNAEIYRHALEGLDGVTVPYVPPECVSVNYQYCVYVPDRDRVVEKCIQQGIDVETKHVDVCTESALFGTPSEAPAASAAAGVVQLPVYASLTSAQAEAIGRRVRRVLGKKGRSLSPATQQGKQHEG
jgi:dTDP-4-amino-4,6-dideoxygalactose transaminase